MEGARRRVLPQRELRQGGRGQDVPRCGGRGARLAMGPGGLGGRSGQHVLRFVSRGVRTRPLRGLDRAPAGRRPPDRARHDSLPVRAPAAAGRVDAAQQPYERQAGAGLVRHPARRVLIPADHGPRQWADRPRLLRGPHQARRQLRDQPRALLRDRALGGAERLLALDDRGRGGGPRGGRADRRPQRRRGLRGGMAGCRRRVPAQDQGLDPHDERPAQRATGTSSASRRRATRTPRSATASATAGPRSTSAR